MKRSNTQSERQIYIDQQIRKGTCPSAADLAARFECSERTIKRDIEFLRDRLNAPIQWNRSRNGYFYSEPTWGIRSLILSERELSALLAAPQALKQCGAEDEGMVLRNFIDRGLFRQVG